MEGFYILSSVITFSCVIHFELQLNSNTLSFTNNKWLSRRYHHTYVLHSLFHGYDFNVVGI